MSRNSTLEGVQVSAMLSRFQLVKQKTYAKSGVQDSPDSPSYFTLSTFYTVYTIFMFVKLIAY